MNSRKVAPAGWGNAVGAYVTTMRAAGRAPGTVRLHRHYLGLLAELYPAGPWRLTTTHLEKFLAREGWAPETRKSARSVVATFYRWAHGRGFIETDPALDLPSVKVPPPNPSPAPEHLVRRLEADESGNGRLSYMSMLASYAGARVGEIAKVLPARDLHGDVLTLHGKGNKLRDVPVIHPPLLARLRADAERGGWAFPNGRGSHLSPGHVSKLLSRAMPPGWSGHKLRHRLATSAHDGTGDLLSVSQILGHASMDTTLRYVKNSDAKRRRAIAAACAEEPVLPRSLATLDALTPQQLAALAALLDQLQAPAAG